MPDRLRSYVQKSPKRYIAGKKGCQPPNLHPSGFSRKGRDSAPGGVPAPLPASLASLLFRLRRHWLASRRAQGKAEAGAIQARGDALRNNPALPTLVASEKCNGVLPTTMVPGNALPFLNLNR